MKSIFVKFNNAIYLLEPREKIKLIYIFIIYIFSIFFDIIGIGLIVPILTVIISGKMSEIYSQYIPFGVLDYSSNELILIVLGFFFMFYIFKSAFGTFAMWYEKKFIYNLQENLSVKLLNKYVIEDYQSFLRRNYSDLVRNIAVEASIFVTGVIHGFVAVMSEILVVIGISILLLIVDPTSSSIIMGTVLFLVIIYLLIFKKKLRNLGIKRQKLESSIFDQLNKSFLLFRETRIFSKHDQLLKNFKNTLTEKNKIALFEDLLSGLPKIYFELLFVILVNGVLIFFIFSGKEIIYIVPILGLYTAAFFRIFPSFNRLIGSINGIIHNYAAFELIEKDLLALNTKKNLDKNISNFKTFSNYLAKKQKPHTLELENISFSYRSNEKKISVLQDLNLTLSSGQFVGLIGESGSGKSTIANIISGFIKIENGDFKINGNPDYNKDLLNSLVGYLPQTTNLLNDTLINNICFSNSEEQEIDTKKINEIVTVLNMKHMIDNLPDGLNTTIQEQGQIFSGGQRQKIALARALYRDTPILIFDESTSSLDEESEKQLIELIHIIKKDRIILFITHNKNLITFFDKTYLIKNRKIHNMENKSEK